jgi:hypothetical protein
MTQVTRTINFSTQELPPLTPEVVQVRYEILDGATVLVQLHVPIANPLTIDAGDVPPGNYIERATSLSATEQVGAPLEQPLTVPAERLIPSSITAA